jgi:peptide/nickel transport system substrate-binding protein
MGHGFYQALNQPCYPGNMGYLPALKGREYNPEKAKKLLAEAGYPNGFKTRLIATTTTSRHALVAIQDDLKAVGIDVKLEIVDRGKFSEYQFKGWKNGLAILQAPLGPNHLRFMSNYLSPSSTRFPVVHGSKAWDSLLDQAVAATDFETQKTLTKKLVKMTYDEAFMVPLWVVDLTVVMQQSVKDDNNAKLGYVVHWTPATTWLSE